MNSILKKLRALPLLLMHAGILEADAEDIQHDPEIKAELEKCPVLKARLEQLSAEWRAVEQDIDALRH